ncbi:MAG: hypothetical protein HQ518_09255 [Rhodopirellula sp.]|nr:hypothetical protein [Rhodopirellula sp.]
MSDSFDPYHIWLGIPPKDQPPNHYRLLGLQNLEENTDVIDAAANRQTAYLHEMAAGPRRKESQQLLNEIAVARRCLLSPEKKQEYDEQLRADAAAIEAARTVTAAPAAIPMAVPIAQVVSPPVPPVPPVASVVEPAVPFVDTSDSPVAEFSHYNFSDSASPGSVVETGTSFPTVNKPPSDAPVMQRSLASESNLSDDGTTSTAKKPVPKRWIIAGCSVLVVVVVTLVLSSGSEPERKSKETATTTKLDGSGAAVTTSVEASSSTEPESPTVSLKETPPKKAEPSLFDQATDQDSFFKVPTSFGGKEKKKK